MFDQLIIGEKASLDDFDASVAERHIGEPTKKEIKDTVPFSNVTYDFSKINGELYWNERELDYEFEIIADTPEELERKKTAFKNWVMNVMEEKLYDPYIPDYHFLATFKDIDPTDDESLEKTTIAVKFTAYPYQIANEPKLYEFTIPAKSELKINLINGGIHRVTPTITLDASLIFKIVEETRFADYLKTGGYWYLNGTWMKETNTYARYTDLIPVSAGDKFVYTGIGTPAAPSVLWYDANKKFLSYDTVGNGVNVTTATLEAPENAAYAMFQSSKYGQDTSLEVITKVEKARYSVTAGEITDDTFMLSVGGNAYTVENPNNADSVLTVKFNEEVF